MGAPSTYANAQHKTAFAERGDRVFSRHEGLLIIVVLGTCCQRTCDHCYTASSRPPPACFHPFIFHRRERHSWCASMNSVCLAIMQRIYVLDVKRCRVTPCPFAETGRRLSPTPRCRDSCRGATREARPATPSTACPCLGFSAASSAFSMRLSLHHRLPCYLLLRLPRQVSPVS